MADKSAVLRGKELANKLRSYSSKAEMQLEKAVLKGALKIEGDAKRRCAVDTGYLRASITHQFYKQGSEPFALVGTNTDYAPHLEEGTSRQAPQPYMRPAFEENIGEIQQDIKAAFKWA